MVAKQQNDTSCLQNALQSFSPNSQIIAIYSVFPIITIITLAKYLAKVAK
jgi:hypothetical protein